MDITSDESGFIWVYTARGVFRFDGYRFIEYREEIDNLHRALSDWGKFMNDSKNRIWIESDSPDLVISDVMMPVMDGLEMCSKLKSDERTSHIPVIMLSARADRGSKLKGLETGTDEYIIKPFDAEELQVRVKNLIEQRKKLIEKFRKEFVSDSAEKSTSPRDQLLEKLMTILNRHLSDSEFNIAQLSDELNMGRSQMFRKVTAITGHTPKAFILNMRLKKAASLFRSGHRHIATVMHLVGFNSQSHFTTCFRKLYGITPSEYIQSKGS